MTQEEKKPLSRKRLLAYNLVVFVSLLLATIFIAYSIMDQFSHDSSILWSWFYPSIVIVTVMMGILLLRPIFLTHPAAFENGKRVELFRYEGEIVNFCLISMFFCLFFSQIFMDYIIIPVIGYEYCEARTEYGPTFGFPTYTYVPDPSLCVLPDGGAG